MSKLGRWCIGVGVLLSAVTTAAAQDRGVVVQILGGGYSHVQNLNATGAPAHWNTGFSGSVSVGYQFAKYAGLHADATFARNKALGAATFADEMFNRYFYGGHLELRYPLTETVAPFVFAGGGAVTVDQSGSTGLANFTKGAGMFGAGLAFAVPNSPVSVMLEGKGLAYKWDKGGFNRTQLDVSYSVGFAYRFGYHR